MNIKNIIVGLFTKEDNSVVEFNKVYPNFIGQLTGVLENIQDLMPIIVRCKTTYGADRKQHIKGARLLCSALVCQIHSLVTTYASYSFDPITKVAPSTPHDIESWCNVTHGHVVHLFGLCAQQGCDIVREVEAQRIVSALNKLHDVMLEMMNEC